MFKIFKIIFECIHSKIFTEEYVYYDAVRTIERTNSNETLIVYDSDEE